METHNESKRKFLKTVAYVAPVIATFSVAPAVAGIGSNVDYKSKSHRKHKSNGHGRHHGRHGSEDREKGHQFFAKKRRFFSRRNDIED